MDPVLAFIIIRFVILFVYNKLIRVELNLTYVQMQLRNELHKAE